MSNKPPWGFLKEKTTNYFAREKLHFAGNDSLLVLEGHNKGT